MAGYPNVERLTPLDAAMPGTYVPMLLTFRTTDSASSVYSRLRRGLEVLARQIPWLAGRVYPAIRTPGDTETHGLEIRWNTDDPAPTLVNRGSVHAEYEPLAAEGMPASTLPDDIWPGVIRTDGAAVKTGAPVFASSLFQFADGQGIGLCVCIHHQAVDGTGFEQVVRLRVRGMAGSALPPADTFLNRADRLSESLSSQLAAVSRQSRDSLFASHPEWTTDPPAAPTELPPCSFKLLSIPIARIAAVKQRLSSHMPSAPTTSTLFCAVLWSALARIRGQGSAVRAPEARKLIMAVNGRRRISADFSTPDRPYLGNVVLWGQAELPAEDAGAVPERDTAETLAKACRAVEQSHSPRIDARFVAEVHGIMDRTQDCRAVAPSWDPLSGRYLGVSSWADIGLYGVDFGAGLGLPDFARVPIGRAMDGLCLILPRKRAPLLDDASEEVLEVIIALRTEDMDGLCRDEIWKSLGDYASIKDMGCV